MLLVFAGLEHASTSAFAAPLRTESQLAPYSSPDQAAEYEWMRSHLRAAFYGQVSSGTVRAVHRCSDVMSASETADPTSDLESCPPGYHPGQDLTLMGAAAPPRSAGPPDRAARWFASRAPPLDF